MTRFATRSSFAESAGAVAEELTRDLPDTPATLQFLFVSQEHADSLPALLAALADRGPMDHLLGCTGVGLIVDDREVDDRPSCVLWSAWLPETQVRLAQLDFHRDEEAPHRFSGLEPLALAEADLMVLLAEPFSFPADVLLAELDDGATPFPVVGGMASGGQLPGEAKVFLGQRVLETGAVAVTLSNVNARAFVSQGCRPVGEPWVITKAERNVIYELGGRPALSQLQRIFDALPNSDKERFRRGIHLGRVINEYQDSFAYGDFLIRNLLGIDQEEGSLQVGDFVRVGQTVQFHLRDAASASEDLQDMVEGHVGESTAAALLFTCNGRGLRLFDEPHHDARIVAGAERPRPTAGLFCQGEVGPVAGRNFVHGFSASVVLFEEPPQGEGK